MDYLIINKIGSIATNDFENCADRIIGDFLLLWPDAKEELIKAREHIVNCARYRKENILFLILKALDKH